METGGGSDEIDQGREGDRRRGRPTDDDGWQGSRPGESLKETRS